MNSDSGNNNYWVAGSLLISIDGYVG